MNNYTVHQPEYYVFQGMRNRCNNPTNKDYPRWGARGIKVCNRWMEKDGIGYKNFIKDMGTRPDLTYSLDRIDSDGNYEPNNCRWATKKEQAANRRKYISNTTGYIGVRYNRKRIRTNEHTWLAMIEIEEIGYCLGTFTDPEQAAIEYDKAVVFFRGYGTTNIL